MSQREWHGGDTLPGGDALREQIAYHLRRSWELAEGMALDGNGIPITDAAQIERSCRWHHDQAQVMATVLLADAQRPPATVRYGGGSVMPCVEVNVAGHPMTDQSPNVVPLGDRTLTAAPPPEGS